MCINCGIKPIDREDKLHDMLLCCSSGCGVKISQLTRSKLNMHKNSAKDMNRKKKNLLSEREYLLSEIRSLKRDNDNLNDQVEDQRRKIKRLREEMNGQEMPDISAYLAEIQSLREQLHIATYRYPPPHVPYAYPLGPASLTEEQFAKLIYQYPHN
jgi:uncharacterized protein YlxW (UPF0749 family)